MSDELKPARRWRFQVHLSTAIVLMFVAGGLIWANVSARNSADFGLIYDDASLRRGHNGGSDQSESAFLNGAERGVWSGRRDLHFGWPVEAMNSRAIVAVEKSGNTQYLAGPVRDWYFGALVLNTFVALVILFAVWFLCEWLIRRRT